MKNWKTWPIFFHGTLLVYLRKSLFHSAANNPIRATVTTGTRHRVAVLAQEVHQGQFNQWRVWPIVLLAAAVALGYGVLFPVTAWYPYYAACALAALTLLIGLQNTFPSNDFRGKKEAEGQVVEIITAEELYDADRDYEYWVAAHQLVRNESAYLKRGYFKQFKNLPLGDTSFGGDSPRYNKMIEMLKSLRPSAYEWVKKNRKHFANWELRFKELDDA